MIDQPLPKTSASPIPENETERLAALHRYNILDTPPEAAFDRITRLAARLFGVPTTLISLVDESRAWFKSCIGFDGQDVPRDVTLCSFSVLTDEPLIIPDTRLDDRFTCNPIVQGEPGVRFYAGAPLLSHDGFNLGTLCLIDNQPRDPLTAEQQATLVDLAAMVVDELELRLAAQRVAQSEEKYRMLFESIDEGFCICEMLFDEHGNPQDYRFLAVNPVFAKLTGLEAAVGKTARELVPNLENDWVEIYGNVVQTGESVRFEQQAIALNRWFNVNAFRINEPQSHQFAILFTEISDRVHAEAERKQAESALRESEELRQRILESSNDCIKVLNLESEILYISQGGCCLLEISDPALVLNENWTNFWQGEAQEQARAAIAAAKAGNMSRFQGNCPTLKGTPKWWDSVITPVRDAAGQVVQLVAISRDITQQKQADDLLRDSEEMFRNMADHAPFMVWVTDPSGSCTYLSQSWYDFTGQTPESSLGLGWLDRTHPDDRSDAERIFLNANEQQKAFRLEYRLQGKDGEYVWAIDAASPWFGVDGQFKGYIGSVIDISDRKQVEAALQESEKQIRNILESINDGFFALDEHWQFTYVNRAAETLLDRTASDLIGQSIWEAYPGLNGSEFEQLYWRVMGDRVSGSLTSFYPDHDRWYEVHVYPAAKGITVYFRNVTEQIQTAAILRQSEDRLRMTLESTHLGTWDWDLITNQLTWDGACKAMFGLPPEAESSIEVFFAGLHPDDREELEQVIQAALNPAGDGKYDVQYRTIGIQDRIERWVAARGQAYFDAAGTPRRFIGTVLDITEQKRVEVEREQLLAREQAAREEAERANHIKDEFLAVLSHELRSPLNPILGWSKLLQQGKMDAVKTKMALTTIERNAQLQAQLIDDLLDISRILSGKLSLTTLPVDLRVVISAAQETVRLAAEAKAIQIQTILSPDAGMVLGDAGRLQQVVWNLLSNAVKFTPNGGRVKVELSLVHDQSSLVKLNHLETNEKGQMTDYVQITVNDNGKGIPESFLLYVFEHFRQEDSATTRKFGGLGLGLAIVRQIVEMHGGTVWAESRGENQGATFTVQLPVLPQIAPVPSEPFFTQAHTEAPLANVQILLVDDDTDTREFEAFLLEQSGARVTAVASGSKALQLLDQWIPDVMISDVGMAEMDGYMLSDQIRSRPPNRGGTIPMIALTAYATEHDRQRALQAGFQMHLTKPLEPELFVSAIVSLLK